MKSVIIGAGTYGEVYATFLKEANIDVIGFVDDKRELQGQSIHGIPVIGSIAQLSLIAQQWGVEVVYCPIGDNGLRVQILSEALRLGLKTPNFIHHSVKIAPNVNIADHGVYILQGTQIMPWVTLERFVMISCGSNIVHHSHLKEGVFVSNGVNLGAQVVAERLSYIGMGATVMTGVKTLGENSLVGAGAVVIKDVPNSAIVAGIPAKVLRYK